MQNILRGFTHSYTTDLATGKINNADATLLVLKKLGGSAKVGVIRKALRKWRPNRSFGYLFNTCPSGGYGFVGGTFLTTGNRVFHHPAPSEPMGHFSNRRTYWYRSAHGTYSITAEGYRRLAEIGPH